MEDFYDLVEHAIDNAFLYGDYSFNCYKHLKSIEATSQQVREFINSSTAGNTALIIKDLSMYIEEDDPTSIEAYGHLGKEKAGLIKQYLYAILKDSWQFEKLSK